MIIGLHGNSHCGKDTFAIRLTGTHGFERKSLADPLRELLLEVNPPIVLDPASPFCVQSSLRECVSYFGWDHVKTHLGGADMLIGLGQGCRDMFGQDVWINVLSRTLKYDGEYEVIGDIVITDIRYPNEVTWLREQGGYLVRIVRPGTVPRAKDNLLTEVRFDAHVINDGTIVQLWEKTDRCLQSFRSIPSGSTPSTTKGTSSPKPTSTDSSKQSTISRSSTVGSSRASSSSRTRSGAQRSSSASRGRTSSGASRGA